MRRSLLLVIPNLAVVHPEKRVSAAGNHQGIGLLLLFNCKN
jgi:hypothetical protein